MWGRRSTGGEECQVFFWFFLAEQGVREEQEEQEEQVCVCGAGSRQWGGEAGRRRASGTDLINDTAGAARTKCSSPAC